MKVRWVKVHTRRFTCQFPSCCSWCVDATNVLVGYDVKYWNELRNAVAQEMHLSPTRVALYERQQNKRRWRSLPQRDHAFSDGVEVDYMRQIDPAHGALYAQERERERE